MKILPDFSSVLNPEINDSNFDFFTIFFMKTVVADDKKKYEKHFSFSSGGRE